VGIRKESKPVRLYGAALFNERVQAGHRYELQTLPRVPFFCHPDPDYPWPAMLSFFAQMRILSPGQLKRLGY